MGAESTGAPASVGDRVAGRSVAGLSGTGELPGAEPPHHARTGAGTVVGAAAPRRPAPRRGGRTRGVRDPAARLWTRGRRVGDNVRASVVWQGSGAGVGPGHGSSAGARGAAR